MWLLWAGPIEQAGVGFQLKSIERRIDTTDWRISAKIPIFRNDLLFLGQFNTLRAVYRERFKNDN